MAFTKCWLAYPAIPGAACEKLTVCVPAGDDPVLASARAELATGFKGLYGAELADAPGQADVRLEIDPALDAEGYRIDEQGRRLEDLTGEPDRPAGESSQQ